MTAACQTPRWSSKDDHLAGDDDGHHQDDGQVHGKDISKQLSVKEDGDKAEEEQEACGKVGGQQLVGNSPLKFEAHVNQVGLVFLHQGEICYCETWSSPDR